MTIVTTKLVKAIRQCRALGLSRRETARRLGLHPSTVNKYESDEWTAEWRNRERARYQRDRENPIIVERRRAVAREWRPSCAGQ